MSDRRERIAVVMKKQDKKTASDVRRGGVDKMTVQLFVGGTAVAFVAFTVGVVARYWGLPLLIVLAGGVAAVYVAIHRVPTGETASATSVGKAGDEDVVRWAVGDELADERVQALTAKLHQPGADKSDLRLVQERRWEEWKQRHRN